MQSRCTSCGHTWSTRKTNVVGRQCSKCRGREIELVQEATKSTPAPTMAEGPAEPRSVAPQATNDEVIRRLIVSNRDLLVQLQRGSGAEENARFCRKMLTFCHFCGAIGDDGMMFDGEIEGWACNSCGRMASFGRPGKD